MARKSPAPKGTPSNDPGAKTDPLLQKRIEYVLGYITTINRQSLVALYQLYAAPDCQVAEVPALQRFVHHFKAEKFSVCALLTTPQTDVLEQAAAESPTALLTRALQTAKALWAAVASAEQSLVAALTGPSVQMEALEPHVHPAATSGCCYYNHSPPAPNVPENLCKNDPDYQSWAADSPCVN